MVNCFISTFSTKKSPQYLTCQSSSPFDTIRRLLSVIFENLDADYQMLMSSGKYEHSCRPKTAIFRFIISIYFPPFFIDHPVCSLTPNLDLSTYFQCNKDFIENFLISEIFLSSLIFNQLKRFPFQFLIFYRKLKLGLVLDCRSGRFLDNNIHCLLHWLSLSVSWTE